MQEDSSHRRARRNALEEAKLYDDGDDGDDNDDDDDGDDDDDVEEEDYNGDSDDSVGGADAEYSKEQ